ncbi:MAG: calcineurin-like phosphoesterase family protein [Phycisphaerae bacterium]|nr:calcineurin-like phosphoesterase family protein [Phycisphaerae bacterium]
MINRSPTSSPWQNCGTGVSPVVFTVKNGVSETLLSLLPRATGQSLMVVATVLGITFGVGATAALAEGVVRGVVFDDRDRDGARDPGEPVLPGVRVSNGREVALTDKEGRYELPVDDDDIIFVIKPRDFMTPVDKLNIPRFYYVHKPAGSPKPLKHPGVAPSGPLPKSVDFPLYRRPEPDTFDVVVLGDPQPRNVKEINYLAHDVVEELIGVDAAFGISLGDVVYDDLGLFEPYNGVVSTIGIPWYNVHGNHDMNYDVTSDELADETWERVYGPPTYSFDWGPVHFVVLDDVMYDGHVKRGDYHSELGRHLIFVENDLKHVAKDALVVLLMHIPIVETQDKEKLFALLKDRPHTFSMSAHWHFQKHFFLGPEDGWHGDEPHHHLVHATACGSWWSGAPDEFGIPHTTMRCGAPNGYSIITFSGHRYSIRFKAARRPANEQMSIFAPDSVKASETGSIEVLVNVYAGSDRSVVELRVDGTGQWTRMKRVKRPDPYWMALKAAEESDDPPNGRKIWRKCDSPHLWAVTLPAGFPKGGHVIEVRARDMFGQLAFGRRVIRSE